MSYTFKRMFPSGIYVDMLNPQDAKIEIKDIAWSLSMQCRFGGCCRHFYSVAEHSLLVSELVPPELALLGLMHDAHEAYIQDINTGFKKSLGPIFRHFDEGWWVAVKQRFDLPFDQGGVVHHADMVALATERRDLGLLDDVEWPTLKGIEPSPKKVQCLNHWDAYQAFLERFAQLGGKP